MEDYHNGNEVCLWIDLFHVRKELAGYLAVLAAPNDQIISDANAPFPVSDETVHIIFIYHYIWPVWQLAGC